jgi:hypothetical protein
MKCRPALQVLVLILAVAVLAPALLAQRPREEREEPRSKRLARRERVRESRLPGLTPEERKPGYKGRLRAQGIARQLRAEIQNEGQWTTLADGTRVWRVAIASPDAWGMRFLVRQFHVEGGKLWIYKNSSSTAAEPDSSAFAGPYTGDGPLGDGEFWTDPVPGESLVIEYVPAPGDNSGSLPFRIRRALHLYEPTLAVPERRRVEIGAPDQDVAGLAIFPGQASESGSFLSLDQDPQADEPGLSLNATTGGIQSKCSPDVNCYASWAGQSKAVASITFIEGQYSYSCTGSLIEDPSGSGRPFFLTADHCVSTEATARTVVAYFQYEAPTCGGVPPSYFEVPRVNGARYLVSRGIAQGDFSLLQLASAAPAGTQPAKLEPLSDPLVGESVTGIHHPGRVEGGQREPNSKRISFGARQRPAPVNVEGTVMPSSLGLIVYWSPGQGYTEPGSSGSPLFNRDGRLIGVLSAGAEDNFTSPCNPSIAVGVYGKLAAAYTTLAPYLGATTGGTTPAPTCTFTVSGAPAQPVASAGGTVSLSIAGVSTCSWTGSSAVSWISLNTTGGTGSGFVSLAIAPNPGSARSGSVTVAGQTITINQSAASTGFTSTTCDLRFDAPGQPLPAAGGSGTTILNVTNTCGFSLGTQASWLSLSANPLNSNSRQIVYQATVNSTGAPRTATITASAPSGTLAFRVLQRSNGGSTGFSDVPASHIFADYIRILKERGVATECSQGNFCPELQTSRGEMAVFLVRSVLGTDQFTHSTTPYFTDVPVSSPYFRYVQKLRDLGYTNGCSPTTYCLNEGVTRGQIALFLIRILQGSSTFSHSSQPYFTDVPQGGATFASVQKLRDLGITAGCTATEFCEAAPNTRGQIAVFLVRAFYSN